MTYLTTLRDVSLSDVRVGGTACEVGMSECGNPSHFRSQALPVAPEQRQISRVMNDSH